MSRQKTSATGSNRKRKRPLPLNHPHILAVYEAGTDDNQQYLITEFIDGVTLREWARQQHPSLGRILDVMIGIAEALACAHEAHIVHRDVKPENILVARQGFAKLLDFGVAKLIEGVAPDRQTRTAGPKTKVGAVVGTIPYMAPEQVSGEPVDARADVFAFGAVLYELLGGRHPFEGKTNVDVLHAILPTSHHDLLPRCGHSVRFALHRREGPRKRPRRSLPDDARAGDRSEAVCAQ